MTSSLLRLARALRERPILGWAACLVPLPLVNGGLNAAIFSTKLPLFLDSILTAIAAAVLGPWQGLLVAFMTNLYQEAFKGFPGVHLPFALCGFVTVLVVSGTVARPGFWSPWRIGAAISLVALGNSLLGAAIATFVFGGGTGANIDAVAAGLGLVVESIFSAAFLARLPMNLIDKALAVLPALALAAALERTGSAAAPRAEGRAGP